MAAKIICFISAAALLWAGLRWFESANLYFPSREHDAVPAAFGMPYEDIWLTAEDGVRLHAWYLDAAENTIDGPEVDAPPLPAVESLPPGPRGPRTLVLFHGNGGNISHRMHKLRIFRAMGLSVLIFDYRGYGKSLGRPSERGTYLDGLAAVDYLSKDKGIPPGELIYYGESLGCAIALQTALQKAPRALLLDSAFTSIVDMGKVVFPFLPVERLVRYRYDNLAKIASLRAPLLVLHSQEDDVVPYAMGRRIFASAPEPKSFVKMRGDHNDGFLHTPAYATEIRAFIAKQRP